MRTCRPVPALLLVLALAAAACGGEEEGPAAGVTPATPAAPGPATFPLTLTDDEGVEITLEAPPDRIVTFAPSNTEILFALGLGDRLVGVSGKYDDYPPAARKIEEVGGAGEFGVDPNVEKVVSLEPDLFLTIAGGEHWKERLRELGIPVFTVNATDFQDLLGDIATVGRLTGAVEEAEALTAEMAAEAEEVRAAVATEPAVSCFFEVYYVPPLTTVGPNTFLFDLLELAGCDPVSAGARSDYPSWSVDRLVAESPEVYLVASESGVSPEAVADRPGFAGIEAVREGRVVLVDSDLVSRPGPRVVQGLRILAEALHPGAVA